jgi:hypothetical protein
VRDWGQAKHSVVAQRRISVVDRHGGKNGILVAIGGLHPSEERRYALLSSMWR